MQEQEKQQIFRRLFHIAVIDRNQFSAGKFIRTMDPSEYFQGLLFAIWKIQEFLQGRDSFENINSFKVREITFQMQQVTFLLKIRNVKFIPIEVNNTFEAGKERIKFLDDVSFFAVSFGKILTDIPIPTS